MKKISYLGPEGTFSQEALLKYSADLTGLTLIPLPTIIEVIKSIDRGDAEEGVVPIENSIEGSVNITQDILTFESEAKIIRELTLPIKHNLIAKKGIKINKIKKVISHPHATAQCRMFLSANLPEAEIIAANSTAEAVKKLTELDPDTAAIGTKIAARLYNLDIIADDIEDSKANKTRFIFVGNYIPAKSGFDKTSIVCFLKKD
jgi:prephenate dehydratase